MKILKENEQKNDSPNSTNETSHRCFPIKSKTLIALPKQSSRDFSTPEKGLTRYLSNNILDMFSSEDPALKIPDAYFLHHFVYNCRTSAFTTNRRSRSTLGSEELKNSMSCECAVVSLGNITQDRSKSTTEIILKMPKRYQDDSLIDIKLTKLALQPTASNRGESGGISNQCSSLQTPQKTEEDSCPCPEEQKPGANENDTNRVSIKLAENLFLSLVTDVDDQADNLSCKECYSQTNQKNNDKFPAIKIFVKCNGETIKEISPPQLTSAEISTGKKNYNQIYCVNTCNNNLNIETSTSCDDKNGKDNFSSLECCQMCCMAVDTTERNICSDFQIKPKCSLRMQNVQVSDSSCTKCSLSSRICVPPKMEKEEVKKPAASVKKPPQQQQRRGSQQSKKMNQKQPSNKTAPPKQAQNKPKSDNRNQSSTSLKNSSKTCVCTSEAKKKSSLCACPPNKDDIVSLGSFSLFFIINDMKTGDCGCKKSDSSELLRTAMICVHVDDSSKRNKSCMPTSTSSCPAMTSCTSRYSSKTSSCSCPSVRAASVSICSCPSVKAGYVCPFTTPKIPVNQSTNTSIKSSMHKTPCCQPSQIRFSLSEKGKPCPAVSAINNTTCQSCLARKRVEQSSVQAYPSSRSACVQPSRTVCPRLQPQGVQAIVSQRSASIQSSVCTTATCSQARQVLSNICPPSCKINLPKLNLEKRQCQPVKNFASQRRTCDVKTGPSFTIMATKSCSCPSLRANVCSEPKLSSQRPSEVCVNATQSKSCSICIKVSKLNDSRDPSLKKVCSFSGECKQDAQTARSKDSMRMNSSCSAVSKTSCSICKELAKLGVCQEDLQPIPKPYKEKPRVIPASPKLKRTKNFNQLSHLDVSGADNFIYSESKKGDLTLITEDYSDLKQAFEKFMVTENAKNPKCKYIKKG